MPVDTVMPGSYTTNPLSTPRTAPLIHVDADPCLAFYVLSSTREIGLLSAQLLVNAVAYRANEMTCIMADLTRRGQTRWRVILGGFLLLVMLPPSFAEG